MSEKTLKRILGALGVLVILWIGSVLLSGRGGGGPAPDGGVASLLEDLDQATVSAIHIVGPNPVRGAPAERRRLDRQRERYGFGGRGTSLGGPPGI